MQLSVLRGALLSAAATLLAACGGGGGGGGGAPEPPPVSVPAAPQNLTATAADGAVTLNWSGANGANAYSIFLGTAQGAESQTPATSGVTTTSYTVSGLTNGIAYYFRVTATNTGGSSGSSNEVSSTPNVAPAAPAGVVATAGDGQVSLSWSESSGATSYSVYITSASGVPAATPTQTGIASTSTTIPGLTNGGIYFFTVVATNVDVSGSPSAEAVAVPARVATANGQLNVGVVVLSDQQDAQIVSESSSQVVFTGTMTLAPGTVLLTAQNAFIADNSTSANGQTVISVHAPQLEDVFSTLKISGTFPITSDEAVATSPSTATGSKRTKRQAVPAVGGSESITQTLSVSGGSGGFSATGSMKVVLACDLDFDFSAGAVQSAHITLSQSDQAQFGVALAKEAAAHQDFPLATFSVPIPVSVADPLLNLIGIRLASLQIPVSALISGSVQFTASATMTASSQASVTVGYNKGAAVALATTATGTTGFSVNTGGVDVSGNQVLAELTATGSVFLHLRPALAFLNQVALLGVDLQAGPSGKLDAQVTAQVPPYCITVTKSLDGSASAFFKAVGISATSKSANFSHDLPPPVYIGSCQLPTNLALTVDPASLPATYMNSLTIDATVTAQSATSAASKVATGSVIIQMGDNLCTATLSVAGSGSCSLPASPAGMAVPVTGSYSGEAMFAPASNQIALDVAQLDSVTALNVPATASVSTPVELSVQVSPGSNLGQDAAAPTGDVHIVDSNGKTICVATLDDSMNGSGSCSAEFLTAGTQTISANYGGDDNYLSSSDSTTINITAVGGCVPPGGATTCAVTLYDIDSGETTEAAIAAPVMATTTTVTVYNGTTTSQTMAQPLGAPLYETVPGVCDPRAPGCPSLVSHNAQLCAVDGKWTPSTYSYIVSTEYTSSGCTGVGLHSDITGGFTLSARGQLIATGELKQHGSTTCNNGAGLITVFSGTYDNLQTVNLDLSTGAGSASLVRNDQEDSTNNNTPPGMLHQTVTGSGSVTWPAETTLPVQLTNTGITVSHQSIAAGQPLPQSCAANNAQTAPARMHPISPQPASGVRRR